MPQCHGPLELGGRVQAVTDRGGNRRELDPLRPDQRAPALRAIGCLPRLSSAERGEQVVQGVQVVRADHGVAGAVAETA